MAKKKISVDKSIDIIRGWDIDEQFIGFYIFPNIKNGGTSVILNAEKVEPWKDELSKSKKVTLVEIKTPNDTKYVVSTGEKGLFSLVKKFATEIGQPGFFTNASRAYTESKKKNQEWLKTYVARCLSQTQVGQTTVVKLGVFSDNKVYTATALQGGTIPTTQFPYNAVASYVKKFGGVLKVSGQAHEKLASGTVITSEVSRDNHALFVDLAITRQQ